MSGTMGATVTIVSGEGSARRFNITVARKSGRTFYLPSDTLVEVGDVIEFGHASNRVAAVDVMPLSGTRKVQTQEVSPVQ